MNSFEQLENKRRVHVDILTAGADVEVNGCIVGSADSSKEELTGISSSANSEVIPQIDFDEQISKVQDIMLKALLSSNSDIYCLAFNCYRGVKNKETILHPILDEIVLSSACNDKVLMAFFEEKASSLYSFIKNLNVSSSDNEYAIKDLIAIHNATQR